MIATGMNERDIAQARQTAYTFLAQVYRVPVDLALTPFLAAITADVPAEPAVAHQQLFGFDVFPHESIFRGDDHLIGGDVADRVIQAYQKHGFRWQGDADHISNQLQLLAWLCSAEQDALEDHRPTIASDMRQRQSDFLRVHLLQWLPPFIVAVQQHGDSFYQEIAALTWQLTTEHAGEIGSVTLEPTPLTTPPSLDESKTSLKVILQFLTLPSASGLWLSARKMAEIGRELDLPRGFGGRIQTMMNLFRSATQFDAVRPLLKQLQNHAIEWDTAYLERDNGIGAVNNWRMRLDQTMGLLESMQHKVIDTNA